MEMTSNLFLGDRHSSKHQIQACYMRFILLNYKFNLVLREGYISNSFSSSPYLFHNTHENFYTFIF